MPTPPSVSYVLKDMSKPTRHPNLRELLHSVSPLGGVNIQFILHTKSSYININTSFSDYQYYRTSARLLTGAEVMGVGWVYSCRRHNDMIKGGWGSPSGAAPGASGRPRGRGPAPGASRGGPGGGPKMGHFGASPPYIKDRFSSKKGQKRIAKHGLGSIFGHFWGV